MSNWANKTYLLIDDFPGMRQMLRDILRSVGVEKADHAGNGAEAITLLTRSRYDVVLCDYMLGPGRNGQQVLEEARVRELIGPATIWMMVSAEKSVESVMGSAEYQPDGYVLKPITEALLLARLERAWNRKQVFHDIDKAYLNKDYLKAARLCDQRIATDKLHALDLMRMKAKLLLKSGEAELAGEIFARVLAARDLVWARSGLAKIHLYNEDYEAAKKLLYEVIAENPNYLEAYDLLASAHQALGELEQTEQILERAAKLSPNAVLRQKNLGTVALKLGNIDVAERAFRKSVAVGENSILRTPDAYLGLARVCGARNEPKEAMQLLGMVQKLFPTPEIRLRAKITEGSVYHESGDWVKARRTAEDLRPLLLDTSAHPDTDACLDMARLLFAVGEKESPADLLQQVVRNNHDNEPLLQEVVRIFEKARLGEQGASLVAKSRKEVAEMMDRGMLLWKSGKLDDAVVWMVEVMNTLPSNVRIQLNGAHILIHAMQQKGYRQELAQQASEALLRADALAPGNRRFAQLMEMLQELLESSEKVAP